MHLVLGRSRLGDEECKVVLSCTVSLRLNAVSSKQFRWAGAISQLVKCLPAKDTVLSSMPRLGGTAATPV